MASWNLRRYLNYGLLIVRANSIVLWWIAFVGLLGGVSLLLKETSLFWPLNIAVTILSIFSTPVIYGIYFVLIEDRYLSIPQIARTYIPGYIWLIIRMYLPPIFVASMLVSAMAGAVPAVGGGGILEITLVLFSLIYLFVIPTYYVKGTGRGAISEGVVFLGRSVTSATPIILAVLLLETSMLLLQYQRNAFTTAHGLGFIAIDFLIFFCASIIDYVIFIMLIFIMKEKPAENGQELS